MERVRFAPSPTGYLHIGSARTFIFNWLYARKTGGVMILRLDDTDVERNTQTSLDSIYEGLNWLGFGWDEFCRQSDRGDLHRAAAQRIFDAGLAYRDFTPAHSGEDVRDVTAGPWLFNPGARELSSEGSDRRAAAGEPFVIRYKVPRGTGRRVEFHDDVYGAQSKLAEEVEDFALIRSNGVPMYHLASCADDADLGITQIIRGQDHLSNTFKHVLIFDALGVPAPKFAHLPLIIAPDGSKLSKRKHGPVVSVTTYRDAGFLPHAYVNFLCLLGWSPKDNREKMSRDELQAAFTFEGVNRANATIIFSDEDPIDPKAAWLNTEHLRAWPVPELAAMVKEKLTAAGLSVPFDDVSFDNAWFESTVNLIRTRFNSLNDFATRGRAYFTDDYEISPDALEKLNQPQVRELLRELAERFAANPEFTDASIEADVRKLAADKGVKAGLLINGSRAQLTGQSVGPSAFALIHAIGRERAVARLRRA